MIKPFSLFTISNLIFKYSKIIHEKEVKIYDYIPFYWKHIPLASILILIFVSGFFLPNYLETVSKNTIIEETDSINEDITETSFVVLEKIDQISKSLANSPFLKESLANMSPDNDPAIAKMLNSYKNSFDISLVCVLDMNGRIVYYSNYPDRDFSKKKNIYKENSKFFEHLKGWIKKGFIRDYNYINKGIFYSASIIDSSKYGRVGIVVVKGSVLSIVRELNKSGKFL
jgi:C4-dicarboxylate-specific signal transduction histidine kinase